MWFSTFFPVVLCPEQWSHNAFPPRPAEAALSAGVVRPSSRGQSMIVKIVLISTFIIYIYHV